MRKRRYGLREPEAVSGAVRTLITQLANSR